MATFNIYQQPAAETPLAKKWFFRALIGSIIIHIALFAIFRSTQVKTITPYTAERLVPLRNFSLTRVSVNENALSDQEEKKQDDSQKSNSPAPSIDIPKEAPTADTDPQDVVMTPMGSDIVKPITTDTPKITDGDLKNLEKAQQNVTKQIDNDLSKVSEQLINDKTQTSSKSVIKLAENSKNGTPGSPSNTGAIPGTKSLDEALANSGGGLQNGDQIGLPGGALFEFDSSDLLPDAASKLGQLAESLKLVQKHHPQASFMIKGYADSIGANTNPQYNIDLSQKRADAVKNLLQIAGVDASKLKSVGLGSTEFIDPPTYDPAKQALEPDNRRVIIVISFPH